MSKLRNALSRWRPRALVDRDIDDEIDCHLGLRTNSYIKAGMTPDVAETMAKQRFGDIEMVKKQMRRARVRRTKLALALTMSIMIVVGLWMYQVTRPAELPSLPPGMVFVGFPSSKPVPPTPTCEGWRRLLRRCQR